MEIMVVLQLLKSRVTIQKVKEFVFLGAIMINDERHQEESSLRAFCQEKMYLPLSNTRLGIVEYT